MLCIDVCDIKLYPPPQTTIFSLKRSLTKHVRTLRIPKMLLLLCVCFLFFLGGGVLSSQGYVNYLLEVAMK